MRLNVYDHVSFSADFFLSEGFSVWTLFVGGGGGGGFSVSLLDFLNSLVKVSFQFISSIFSFKGINSSGYRSIFQPMHEQFFLAANALRHE